jgi:DNA-binding beta-propeller fold protein YncE
MADCNHNGNKTKGTCVECDIPQMARNNYFTGKLLVERDFVDEQRYFMGKERRHNQQLHGWGVVCGLKVKQHPNPACQDQYVIIEPGTAIDCCGAEIHVGREEYFDFRSAFLAAWQAQNGKNAQPDTKPHTIEISVRYRECPTEDVPALFDECGCDDSACKPNRILETYAFDVLIDPPAKPSDPASVQLTWDGTLNIASAQRVALSSATKTVYVLAQSGSAASLYAVSSQNGAILASQSFANNQALDVAVSPDGSRIYVALQGSTAGSDPQILVVDSSDLSKTVSTLTVTGGSGANVRLGVVPSPDGRLFAVNSKAGALVWGTDINTSATPAAPTTVTLATGSSPVDVAIAPDGSYAFVADNGTGNVSAVSMADLTKVTTVAVGTGSAKPSAIAVASTTAGDSLAVLDHDNQTLYLIGMRPDPANAQALGNPVQGFAHHPAGVLMSAGAKWVYVLEQDDADKKAYVQSVDAHGVELQQANVLGSAVAVGNQPESMALSSDGQKLYVAYNGDGQTDPGGVAVVDVTDQDCGSLFTQTIEGCPDCSAANCVVLATINGYVFGSAVTDSLIDNLTDRPLLPSTSVITEVVECILQHGVGAGLQGPQGLPGQPGTSVKSADAESVAAGQPADAQFDPNTGNIHFKIPEGADGAAGATGPGIDKVTVKFVPCGTAVPDPTLTGTSPNRTLTLTIPSSCNTALTHIADINWKHNSASLSLADLQQTGLLIAFDASVIATDITTNDVKLLIPRVDDSTGARCWCEAPTRVLPGNFTPVGVTTSTFTPGPDANGMANGVRIILSKPSPSITQYRVQVLGDFIRDETNQRGLDADHLPPWLPNHPTGDGIEGGIFESWFTITQGQ